MVEHFHFKVTPMGQLNPHYPVLLIAAVTSRYESAIQWAIAQAAKQWGEVQLESALFDFSETGFYTKTMGADLQKQLVAFQFTNPADLPDFKITSNQWEKEYATFHPHPETRPLNIDPGYITEAKLVLATTKDRDHRVYLRDGIYAEVTLHYQQHKWNESRWTYPDYQRDDFQSFFTKCRNLVRDRNKTDSTST